MSRFWPAIRLSAGLVSLCVSVFFIACALGLVPDRDAAVLAGRKTLCESLAVSCSLSAQKDDLSSAEAALHAAVERNPDILSAGLRREDGKLLINVAAHGDAWESLEAGTSTETQMQVPILRDQDVWGTLELRFVPLHGSGWLGRGSMSAFVIFFSLACFGAFYLFLRPIFQGMQASPGAGAGAVPHRVKSAMNTLAEGVLILDKNERIAMANEAFSQLVGMSPSELQGKKVGELPFFADEEETTDTLPWKAAVRDGQSQTGIVMGLKTDQAIPKRVSINSTPILGDDGVQRGAMATFDNLTNLERKHAQLRKVLSRLRVSRKVVRRQNQELKALATRDPLTGCFNRRTLFIEFEKMWESSKRFKKPLSCVMVDVDHFKSINDRFGHQVGDDVLKAVAETLRKTARKTDVVCRYGGEEFCVLLPQIDIAEGEQAAERFRAALAAQPLGGVSVTASFGVSSWSLGPKHPQDMMDQADKALYAAKRSGRNRVERFDRISKEMLEPGKEERKKTEPVRTPAKSTDDVAISFQAVSGLLAALAYRHADTAEHCRRVADLCVLASGGLMSQKDAYLLEMAALLHDIGKLGVPDNVLLKAGPLSAEEWKTIRTHESIGVEIIRAAFTSDGLADLVRLQHCWYGGTPGDVALPKGQKIPLAARLIAVANAYDAMTTEHSYRKAMSRDEAFTELRRCSGTQFDPVVVEHFIGALSDLEPGKSKHRKVETLSLSKQAALRIGVQIEKLAAAVDVQDMSSLTSLAAQLKSMAEESHIATIAQAAGKLEQSAAANSSPVDLMELTIDLLEMCRETQRALLPAIPRPEKRKRPKTLESIDLRAAEARASESRLTSETKSDSPSPRPTPLTMSRPAQFVKSRNES